MPKTIDYFVLTPEEQMLAVVTISIWRAIYNKTDNPTSLVRLTGNDPISQSQMQEARNSLMHLNEKATTGRDEATNREIHLWFDATLNVIQALQRVIAP